MTKPLKGKLFVFEGMDGCGKSTQIQMASTHLSNKNIPHSIFEFPGNSNFSNHIREVLDKIAESYPPPSAEAFLYFSIMQNLFVKKILPILEKGGYVLLDRFFLSTFAYQGATDKKVAQAIYDTACLWFDRKLISAIFFLDIDPETAQKRIKLRSINNDKHDNLPLHMKQNIRSRYWEIIQTFPDSSLIIDADMEPNKISDLIFKKISSKIEI